MKRFSSPRFHSAKSWSLVGEWSFQEVHNTHRENLGSHNNSTILNSMSDGLKGVESKHMWHLSSMSVFNLVLHEFTRIALYQSAQMKAPFFLLLISSRTLPHLSFKRGNEHAVPCHLLMAFLVVKQAPTNYNNIATFPWLPYQMIGVNVNRITSSNKNL